MHHFRTISEFRLELQLRSRNTQFRSKSTIFLSCVILKFDRWPWKTIGHIFYATSSFVHHFIVIGEFKLGLQSGNAILGSKTTIFFGRVNLNFDRSPWTRQIGAIWKLWPAYSLECPIWVKIGDVLSHVTLKFDGCPWKTIGHLSFAVWSFVQHFIAISEFKLELLSGNAQFGSNSTIFRVVWPWNLTYDLEKTIGHLYYATSSFMHHFVAIGEFKLELQYGNDQFGSKSMIFWAVWPCNLMYDLEKL